MAFWSQSEYLSSADSTATIQYKSSNGTWTNIVNLLDDNLLPADRNNPADIYVNFQQIFMNLEFMFKQHKSGQTIKEEYVWEHYSSTHQIKEVL